MKLRGFRIELGDIETALGRHPAVHQAVVLLREDSPGDRRLVAYLVTNDGGGEPDDRELRSFLARSLPEHMVPSAFVTLPSFPLSSNGKLDRKALAAPTATRSDHEPGYVPPRNAVEEMLASIWQEVLGITRVGVHDHFFHLGGHSLLGVRLLARIEDVLGIDLPISTLFRAGTIERMAIVIDRHKESPGNPAMAVGDGADDRVVALQPRGDGPPVFMLPGFGSACHLASPLSLLIGNVHPVYGIQPTADDLDVLPYHSLEELASELIKDIRRVASSGPYHLLGFSAGGMIAFEIAQQLRGTGEQVGLLGLLDTYGPGYARLLPLHTRLVRHIRMIQRLESSEKVRYAIDRSRAILDRLGRLFATITKGNHKVQTQQPRTDRTSYPWEEVKERYRHRAYPGRVDLFAANKPDWLGTDLDDPKMGWGSVVEGEIKLHPIPGNHLEIIKLPWANHLAVEIRKCLDSL